MNLDCCSEMISPLLKHYLRAGQDALDAERYSGGIMTLSQHEEILMLGVQRGFSGTSGQGIGIGSQAQAVLSRYGVPTRRLAMARGDTWSYDRHRIAFHLQNGQVVGWLVY